MEAAVPEAPASQVPAADSQASASQADTQFPDSQADSSFPWTKVKHLIANGSTKQLIEGVATASGRLAGFHAILHRFGENPDVQELVQSIDHLQKRANPRGAVIGVVGSTGAGKSSVINAVLDEEGLVPTNAMRACTAAIIEITWNDDQDPARRYKAEVEFIKTDEWKQELRVLFNDLVHHNGQNPEDMTNPDSQAGITLAKVRAVYPDLKNEDFIQGAGIVDDLMGKKDINDVLGITMCFYADTAAALQEQLQPYIDSKEKKIGDQQSSQNDETTMSTWPLVKVVRVYTKAEVLRSGLVLVDLPGVHDSNAARAAMAEDYMKRCNSIWVVAPITRAVDDKSAHALLGEARQRQLQFDGAYSNLTMICSKADDISVTEVTKHFVANEIYAAKLAEVEAEIVESREMLEKKRANLQDVEQRLKDSETTQKQNANRIAELGAALIASSKGKQILVSPGKRELDHPRLPKAKRVLRGEGSGSDVSSDTEDSDSDSNGVEEITMSKVDAKHEMERLREENTEIRATKKALKQERKPLTKEVKTLEKAYKETLKDKKQQLCIKYRNEYSRGAVQTRFKCELWEREQERIAEDDDHDADIAQDPSYYDELAQRLPVFCVSARAYMKLTDKLPHDEPVRGFECAEDTEIPSLQEHASIIANDFRSLLCRRFLGDFLQIVRSLVLQLLMEEKPLELAKELQQKETDHLTETLAKLRLDLKSAEDELSESVKEVEHGLSRRLNRGCKKAQDAAEDVVAGWFKKRDEGGMLYMTFAALCRRDGRFQKPTGALDLNEDLAKALKEAVARRWGKAFTDTIPGALDVLGETTARLIAEFRADTEGRRLLRRSAKAHAALSDLIRGYEQSVSDMETRKEFVAEHQKDASRAFTPVIAEVMGPTYHDCLNETGKGCYKRMKTLISERVKQEDHMYDLASTEVLDQIAVMFSELTVEQIHNNTATALAAIEKKYKNLILGTTIFASLEETRAKLRKLLDGTDDMFEIPQSSDVLMPDAREEEVGHGPEAAQNPGAVEGTNAS